jgi:hypothetical protein
VRKGLDNDMHELTLLLIADLIQEMTTQAAQNDGDSKLCYLEAFIATDFKNWIKKVKKHLDLRTGKSGVPLRYVI